MAERSAKIRAEAKAPVKPAAEARSVRVNIFDQQYHLRGTDAAYIERLAAYVDAKIRAVAGQTNTVDMGRLAVLAALNIADELFILRSQHQSVTDEVDQKAERLVHALDALLSEDRKAG